MCSVHKLPILTPPPTPVRKAWGPLLSEADKQFFQNQTWLLRNSSGCLSPRTTTFTSTNNSLWRGQIIQINHFRNSSNSDNSNYLNHLSNYLPDPPELPAHLPHFSHTSPTHISHTFRNRDFTRDIRKKNYFQTNNSTPRTSPTHLPHLCRQIIRPP